jgi:hypothetical protein
MKSQGQKYFEEYVNRFSTYSDSEIISTFNFEVGNSGWGTARASFLAALHDEFIRRKIDFSLIGDTKSLSFKSTIKLEETKIYLND